MDITGIVQQAVSRAKLRQGLATVFVTGSTAGVIPPPIALPKADIRRKRPKFRWWDRHDLPFNQTEGISMSEIDAQHTSNILILTLFVMMIIYVIFRRPWKP